MQGQVAPPALRSQELRTVFRADHSLYLRASLAPQILHFCMVSPCHQLELLWQNTADKVACKQLRFFFLLSPGG